MDKAVCIHCRKSNDADPVDDVGANNDEDRYGTPGPYGRHESDESR